MSTSAASPLPSCASGPFCHSASSVLSKRKFVDEEEEDNVSVISVSSHEEDAPEAATETSNVTRPLNDRTTVCDFVINNYTDEHLEFLAALTDDIRNGKAPWCKYICYGLEVGESGTPHVQGCMKTANSTSFRSFINKVTPYKKFSVGNRASVRAIWNSFYAAMQYCKKEGKWFEAGTPPNEPAKKARGIDWDGVREVLTQGGPEQVAEQYPKEYIMYYRGIHELWRVMKDKAKTQWEKPFVVSMYGGTGSGKTREAFRLIHESCASYYVRGNTKWCCGMKPGTQVVLWDDMRRNKEVPFAFLLRLLDGHPGVTVETKGSHVVWRPKIIILTTPISMQAMYTEQNNESFNVSDGDFAQLSRRIDMTINFDDKGILFQQQMRLLETKFNETFVAPVFPTEIEGEAAFNNAI